MKIPFKKRWKKLPKWKRLLIIVVILAVAAGLVWAKVTGWPNKAETDEPVQYYYSQLTGNEVEQSVAERPILGIMVENSTMARPQTGLSSAGIVFEAVTEGGITRYLALYQDDLPETVGPIRSARPHFVNWVSGFDSSLAHVGGSAEALDMIKRYDLKSLNQFSYADPYFRSNQRPAPHNMYGQLAKLSDLQSELNHQTSQMNDIPRSEDSPSETPTATKITINFSSANYLAEFRYNPDTNDYIRYLAGQPDKDAANDKHISVKNLVVFKADNSQKSIGTGEAVVYKDGLAIKATWRQNNRTNRIAFYDSSDVEIPLNRGKSWFAAVPSSGSFSAN